MTNESHVTPGRLYMNQRQMPALIIGTTGTNGTLKDALISGCFFLNTMTAMEMTVNAASVPMFTRWASVPRLIKPAIPAATIPVSHVLRNGVLNYG